MKKRQVEISNLVKRMIVFSAFIMVFLPIIWGVGFSYHLYGNHPWPGIAIYSHMGVICLICIYIYHVKSMWRADSLYLYSVLTYLFLTVVYSLFFLILSSKFYTYDAFIQSVLATFYFLSYFTLGFFLLNFKWPRFFVFSLFFLFLMVSVFEVNIQSHIPVSLYSIYGGFSETLPNYQLVSLSILFLSVLVYRSELKYKFLYFFLIITMTFLTGGRSEFLGFIFSLLIIFIFIFIVSLIKRTSVKSNYIYIIMLFFVVFIFILFFLSDINSDFLNNRNFEIFELGNSSSWQAREGLKESNMAYILNSPFFGDFGSHFNISKGSYIHNVFSVWQQYGIFVFLLYFFIMVYPLIRLMAFYFESECGYLIVPMLISFYCLLLIIVSKSFLWSYAGLSGGVYLSICYQKINFKSID